MSVFLAAFKVIMFAGCCPRGCFFLLTCLGRRGCHAACFAAHREAEKTTKSSAAIFCPTRSLSLLLLLADTRRECLSSRETVIKYNHLVFVSRTCQKSSSGFKFTFFCVVRSGEGEQRGSLPLFYSPDWPRFSIRGNLQLIATFQRGVRFASSYAVECRGKKTSSGKLSLLCLTKQCQVQPKRAADRCNICADSLESYAVPLEPV